jgi:hypothetical protein
LTKLAEEIERRFDIEVQIDSRALNEASIPETLELSIDLHDVALVSALNAALRFDKLTWGIWDESLWITTESEADQHLTVIIYNVADLGDTDGDETSVDFEVLTDAISTTVAPNSWDTVGGPGNCPIFVLWNQRTCHIANLEGSPTDRQPAGRFAQGEDEGQAVGARSAGGKNRETH